MPLLDEQGQRIRGRENREAAEMALARVKVDADGGGQDQSATGPQRWLVAKACSEYLQYCGRGVAKGTISKGHCANATAWLNDLCSYCGALAVADLKKGHITTWMEKHPTWRSSATQRSVLAVVLAAFNYAEEMFGVRSPLKGLKKPQACPRLHSFSADEERAIYGATEERFKDFIFAAIHSGLRPFSELARLVAEDVEQAPRGMMWRVYASKTKKTRKIPVRAEVAELTRRLLKSAPRGSGVPLFRNTKGSPWKRMTGVVRFLSIKAKLGWDQDPLRSRYSCYTCRHTFAHRMLSGYWNNGVGCSIETLAELIGDTPKVAFDHYGKEWGQHYQDPLWAAIGAGAGNARTPPAATARPGSKPRETKRPRRTKEAGAKKGRRR
jgi:integrase